LAATLAASQAAEDR